MAKRTPQQKPKSQPKTVQTLREVAAYCGVSVTAIQNWKATAGFPIEENGEFSPFKIGRWHMEREIMATGPASVASDQDDDGSGASDVSSPALERLREEQWRIKRMDRIKMERGLIDRSKVHSFVLRVASLLRNATDSIQRIFGEDAYQLMIDTLDDIEEETEREFRDDPEIDEITAEESV